MAVLTWYVMRRPFVSKAPLLRTLTTPARALPESEARGVFDISIVSTLATESCSKSNERFPERSDEEPVATAAPSISTEVYLGDTKYDVDAYFVTNERPPKQSLQLLVPFNSRLVTIFSGGTQNVDPGSAEDQTIFGNPGRTLVIYEVKRSVADECVPSPPALLFLIPAQQPGRRLECQGHRLQPVG